MAADGHWLYWNPRDRSDGGSIIDFIRKHRGLTTRDACRELRAWAASPQPPVQPNTVFPPPPLDLARVSRVFDRARQTEAPKYLTDERRIAVSTLGAERFHASLREDGYGRVLFSHRDRDGALVGFERKGPNGVSDFAAGGRRALWQSVCQPGDVACVLVESAIDALSYYQLFAPPRAFFVSTGGTSGRRWQEGDLKFFLESLPPQVALVAAFDDDAGGDHLTMRVGELAGEREVRRHRPPAKDWNEVVKLGLDPGPALNICPTPSSEPLSGG